MSTHPNAMMIAVLSPADLPRKTLRALREACGADPDDSDANVEIPTGYDGPEKYKRTDDYGIVLMESDYDEDQQISAPEGSIVLWDFLTYGYGETKLWADVAAQQQRLAAWCDKHCPTLNCTYEIRLTANYW